MLSDTRSELHDELREEMRVVVFDVETREVDRLVSVRDGHDLDDLNMRDERDELERLSVIRLMIFINL